MKFIKNRDQRGFTMLELLVVVAIVSVIVTVVVVGLNNIRVKSRDARRITDIQQIRSALERYNMDNNSYPSSLAAGSSLVGPNGGRTYLATVPTPFNHPDGSCTEDSYTYTQDGSGTSYHVAYCLGGAVDSVGPGSLEATPNKLGIAVVACTPSCDGKICGDDGCGGTCSPGCSGGTPYCSPDQTTCLAVAECDSAVCGDGSSLNCDGLADYATSSASLVLNSSNASAYVTETTYYAIKIGNQCWLNKDLNIGSVIPVATAMSTSTDAVIEKWCSNSSTEANCVTNGGLYTFPEAMYLPSAYSYNSTGSFAPSTYLSGSGATGKRQGLCPKGWHIPSDYEFAVMENYADSSVLTPATPQNCNSSSHSFYPDNVCSNTTLSYGLRGTDIGTKIKVAGAAHLNFILSGYRHSNGTFTNVNIGIFIWSSSQVSATSNWARGLSSANAKSNRATVSKSGYGLPIRCLKD